MKNNKIITIDGPSGSGKGAISRLLAQKLGWDLLDSGALYRLVALQSEQENIGLADVPALVNIARNLPVVFHSEDADDETRVLLNGEDVSLAIRAEAISERASKVAVLPEVREALLQRQRDYATENGLVADGRDMGTVVFPQAALKLYLTASAKARAQRRHKQLLGKGISAKIDGLYSGILARDERDASRSSSPLKPADDAIQIDTTNIGIDEVMQIVVRLVEDLMS
ncbi:MAG: (d)CMP kinase [Gammaproteobacteria bacterium]|nr:(d)CMP kinase [Gammaproteobacteria bacterium]NNC98065.1 (d)CMP kinase [Gammaproteobacteria bacterium]NNM14615.1 (d)CMP kinase [Gammaproteobacteria bacterium]